MKEENIVLEQEEIKPSKFKKYFYIFCILLIIGILAFCIINGGGNQGLDLWKEQSWQKN